MTGTERSDVISNEKKKKSWKSNCKRIRNEKHENCYFKRQAVKERELENLSTFVEKGKVGEKDN